MKRKARRSGRTKGSACADKTSSEYKKISHEKINN